MVRSAALRAVAFFECLRDFFSNRATPGAISVFPGEPIVFAFAC